MFDSTKTNFSLDDLRFEFAIPIPRNVVPKLILDQLATPGQNPTDTRKKKLTYALLQYHKVQGLLAFRCSVFSECAPVATQKMYLCESLNAVGLGDKTCTPRADIKATDASGKSLLDDLETTSKALPDDMRIPIAAVLNAFKEQ
jgi:hypothetical protein